MDRVDLSHLAPVHGPARGPLRVAPMAHPPAAEIARMRAEAAGASGGDSIEFGAAARRLAQSQRPWAADNATPARPAAADRLVGARVRQAAFQAPTGAARAADAPLPFYRDPGQANAAATAVAGSRLDVTG